MKFYQYQPLDLLDCEPDSLDFSVSDLDLLLVGFCALPHPTPQMEAEGPPASFSSSLSLSSLWYSQSSSVSLTLEMRSGTEMWPICCANSASVKSCSRHAASLTHTESLRQTKNDHVKHFSIQIFSSDIWTMAFVTWSLHQMQLMYEQWKHCEVHPLLAYKITQQLLKKLGLQYKMLEKLNFSQIWPNITQF